MNSRGTFIPQRHLLTVAREACVWLNITLSLLALDVVPTLWVKRPAEYLCTTTLFITLMERG